VRDVRERHLAFAHARLRRLRHRRQDEFARGQAREGLQVTLRLCAVPAWSPSLSHATRRRFDVCPLATARAERVKPRARTIRMTVPKSGLPDSPSAWYRLSRFKPAFVAIPPIPRARATRPCASRTKSASPDSSAAAI